MSKPVSAADRADPQSPAEDRPDPSDPDSVEVSLDFLEPCDVPGRLGKLGAYGLREVIGRGGRGVVLRAHDSKLNRVVAVKVLAPKFAANPTARKRFSRGSRRRFFSIPFRPAPSSGNAYRSGRQDCKKRSSIRSHCVIGAWKPAKNSADVSGLC